VCVCVRELTRQRGSKGGIRYDGTCACWIALSLQPVFCRVLRHVAGCMSQNERRHPQVCCRYFSGVLQGVGGCLPNRLYHRTTTHCIILQHTAKHCNTHACPAGSTIELQRTATHILQHAVAHCTKLQHTCLPQRLCPERVESPPTLQHVLKQHVATRCNTHLPKRLWPERVESPDAPKRGPRDSLSFASCIQACVCCSVL